MYISHGLRCLCEYLEVPELRLLYHTQDDISESFHGTPQIVLFDSYDKFMSLPKCHFCPYCHTECLREKPGPLANFDDWWAIQNCIFIIRPYSYLGIMTQGGVCRSEAFRFSEAKAWSETLHWSETLQNFASGEAKIPYQFHEKNLTFGRPSPYLSSSTEQVAATTTTLIPVQV